MNPLVLPEKFLEEMKRILGPEYPSFLASYSLPPRKGLRVNTLKSFPQTRDFNWFLRETGFHLTPVPWTKNGFYYEEGDQPSRHPLYSAGLYYLQEPSAMAPAAVLPVRPGEKVLDLCAAPGGKATELGAKLRGEGILVANDLSSARAKVLLRNIELYGIRNACVICSSPRQLKKSFPGYFDKILVDAPCSGEGMFRKDESVAAAWSFEKVIDCAARQREILSAAADMLRPGGMMLYSTCTFSPEEDELTILSFLMSRTDMELIRIPDEDGRESFSPGLSQGFLQQLGYLEGIRGRKQDEESVSKSQKSGDGARVCADLTDTRRIWPHKAGGEGHFLALLRKRPKESRNSPQNMTADGSSDAAGSVRRGLSGKELREAGADEQSRKKDSLSARGRRKGGSSSGAAHPAGSAADRQVIESFINPYLHPADCPAEKDKAEDGALEIHEGHTYLMPPGMQTPAGVRVLRAGLYLGELKKNRFEPAQELALALPVPEEEPDTDLPEDVDGKYVCLPADDRRLQEYLRGSVIEVRQSFPNGWRLLCAGRYPIGWGKLVDGQFKNKYPSGWRIPG